MLRALAHLAQHEAQLVLHRFRPMAQSRLRLGLIGLRNKMAGAIILVLALLAFPIIVGLSTAGIAALLGHLLYRDADERHAKSELRELNI
jgi:hypothetical protein